MILSVLVAAALAAADAPTLAVPGLNAVRLAPGEISLYSELLSQKLIERGLKVVTARDVEQLLGVERQKQLLGCDDNASGSCVTELIGALGVDAVLSGDIGMLGSQYAINLKMLDSHVGSVIALYNAIVPTADGVPDALAAAADVLASKLAKALKRPDIEATAAAASIGSSHPRDRRLFAILPIVVGVGALAGAAVLEILAQSQLTELRGSTTVSDVMGHAQLGRTYEPLGYLALGVGVAACAAAVLTLVFGGHAASPSVSLTPGGATLGLTGALP